MADAFGQQHSSDPTIGSHDEEHPDNSGGLVGTWIAPAEDSGSRTSPAREAVVPSEGFHPSPSVNVCAPISGTYVFPVDLVLTPYVDEEGFGPLDWPPEPETIPGLPHDFEPGGPPPAFGLEVRIDVDGFYPQKKISIAAASAGYGEVFHALGTVTADECRGANHRVIQATIETVKGDASLYRWRSCIVEALPASSGHFGYGAVNLHVRDAHGQTNTYPIKFTSPRFGKIAVEIDVASDAAAPRLTFDTSTHANRPASLPKEVLTLENVYRRAGFSLSIKQDPKPIPIAQAGADKAWDQVEMHDAMVKYWSRFRNAPNWAMWLLFAKSYFQYGTYGIMFDNIGPNHRQGTAVFTDLYDSFIPAGEKQTTAWAQRDAFHTVIHEMGHTFNLAHSWQKTFDPWHGKFVRSDEEARSFMNYPDQVKGKDKAFYADFRFRFTDEELLFMRHAPRSYVQMGNANWADDHGRIVRQSPVNRSGLRLEIRPNRQRNAYRFLEPVNLELKLSNHGDRAIELDADIVSDSCHSELVVQRGDGPAKRWKPYTYVCHRAHSHVLEPGAALYGRQAASHTPDGWLIDEPGFYHIQAAVQVGEEVIRSNVLRIYVMHPLTYCEASLAPDYFCEDVGRIIEFNGAPSLESANDVLHEMVERCPDNPASRHARAALASPYAKEFKSIVIADGGSKSVSILPMQIDYAGPELRTVLLDDADAAAESFGHIGYFAMLRRLAENLSAAGDDAGARDVHQQTVELMVRRHIAPNVVQQMQGMFDAA